MVSDFLYMADKSLPWGSKWHIQTIPLTEVGIKPCVQNLLFSKTLDTMQYYLLTINSGQHVWQCDAQIVLCAITIVLNMVNDQPMFLRFFVANIFLSFCVNSLVTSRGVKITKCMTEFVFLRIEDLLPQPFTLRPPDPL